MPAKCPPAASCDPSTYTQSKIFPRLWLPRHKKCHTNIKIGANTWHKWARPHTASPSCSALTNTSDIHIYFHGFHSTRAVWKNTGYAILKILWLSFHQSELCYCVLYATTTTKRLYNLNMANCQIANKENTWSYSLKYQYIICYLLKNTFC